MNSTPRDAPAPGHREDLLPSVARTPSVTQVTPAKKITFLKRGDPRFAGVRLAVHQRAFRSFGALMDELSQRVPLSFGVRSVTTPRGLHGLSTLEQLQDGGCYLCSDKKPPRTPGGLGQPQGRSPSAQQLREFEAPGTASTCKGLKASRRITLVKNGDPRLQQTVVLSHRNTRNLTAFLSKASDLLRFPVKHVYTTSGKRPPPVAHYLSLFSLARHCAPGSWGPKAKQSVIHTRSRLENRPRQFSLMSERSGHSDPSVCPHRACMCPAPNRHPLNTPARLGPLVAGEDIEKNVSMNEDGSLSVEMKVRFHLLGEEPLLWSRRLGRASTLTATSREGPDDGEADLHGCVWKGLSRDPSEPGAQGLGPCEAGGVGAFDQGQQQQGSRYEIWMNPLYTSQGEWSASQWRSGLTQNSHCRAPRSQRVTSRKRGSKDRASPASSGTPPGGSEPSSSCCSGSLEDAVASCGPHLASGAGEGRGNGAALGCRDPDGCLKPRTRGLTDALPDSCASARLHFFDDDDLGSPASKVRFTDSPRYQELLSTFQALWPGSGLRNGELESDLRELGWRQALPALGPHVATEDFRPTSSSGVDVGSGSGGSGEGSGPCTVDCSLVSEKMELPLSISCQGPDSRTSGNQEVPGNQQLSSYEAEGAASEDGAEKNGREQMLGGDPDQGDKNTMQEEGVQSREIKEEKERAELQAEGVRGFPEEEGIMGLELSGPVSQDGAGVWENKSLHEEEPGDPTAVDTQSSSGRRGSPPEPPRSLSERCLDASGSQSGPKAEPPLEKLLGAAETGCGQTLDKLTQGAGERATCKGRRGSLISDPVWVSKLLKTMEKAFMDHLAAATAELCTRWGLQGDHLLDQMVAELQRDVGQRLQDSVEKELLKVQSWAGGMGTGPPREALRWEASLQTEERRRRLQALRNLSPFSEQTRGREAPSFSLEDLPIFRGALGTQLAVEAKGEEFCPCEACVRKKISPASPVEAAGSASAPIRKAFDLQHILQKKQGGCADGEAAEVGPAVEREVEPLHRDPSGTGTARGTDGDPEPGSGQGPGAEEGDQTLGRDEEPWGTEEEAGAQEKEGETEPCAGSDPWEGLGRGEQGMGGEEGGLEAGCGAEDTGEPHGLGGGGLGPGGRDAGAETKEAQGAAREEQSETGGGHGGDEEGGPQKGSEDEPWDGYTRSTEDQATDIPDPERKVTGRPALQGTLHTGTLGSSIQPMMSSSAGPGHVAAAADAERKDGPRPPVVLNLREVQTIGSSPPGNLNFLLEMFGGDVVTWDDRDSVV
ncbi:hypothetical protein JEQ12_009341 [Ovis aries]|uniref:Doublecortin domain-containing protein n=1 Tax=Ovis aries TaxID=9940 RepID=A0A836AM95_SHEEP|nr:hypothetical protein JEQ12_009341 [Ovis aries]